MIMCFLISSLGIVKCLKKGAKFAVGLYQYPDRVEPSARGAEEDATRLVVPDP
jgi:hypothetical protein